MIRHSVTAFADGIEVVVIEVRIRHAGQEPARAGGGEILRQHRGVEALEIASDLADADLLEIGLQQVQPVAAAIHTRVDEEILMLKEHQLVGDGAAGGAGRDVLARGDCAVAGIGNALERRHALGCVVREIVAIDHVLAVCPRDREQRLVHRKRLLRDARERVGSQALVEIDAEARGFRRGIEPRPVDEFQQHLLEGGRGHRISSASVRYERYRYREDEGNNASARLFVLVVRD